MLILSELSQAHVYRPKLMGKQLYARLYGKIHQGPWIFIRPKLFNHGLFSL